MIYSADEIHDADVNEWPMAEIRTTHNGVTRSRWVLARPVCGGWRTRLKAIWLVLTGRADAVTWLGQ